MAHHQITRTRKDGPDYDRRIDACEVNREIYRTDQIIIWIEAGAHTFYTNHGGQVAAVYVRQRNGRKYLTTSPDGHATNNLLLLPDC